MIVATEVISPASPRLCDVSIYTMICLFPDLMLRRASRGCIRLCLPLVVLGVYYRVRSNLDLRVRPRPSRSSRSGPGAPRLALSS